MYKEKWFWAEKYVFSFKCSGFKFFYKFFFVAFVKKIN